MGKNEKNHLCVGINKKLNTTVFKINLIQDPNIRRLYQERLHNFVEGIIEEKNIDKEWCNIIEAIARAADEAIGKINK